MANNYLQFSEEFQLNSQEEIDWIENKFQENEEFFIHWEIDKKKLLWIYSEEYCDVEHLASIFHEFLKVFRSDKNDIFKLTWAEFCSKLRVGKFGGGTIFVCKEFYIVESAADVLYRISELNKLEDNTDEENLKHKEYEQGYDDAINSKDFRPTSQSYMNGYKTGEFTREYKKQQ